MSRFKTIWIGLCVGIVSVICQTAGGDLVTPTTVTSSTAATDYRQASHLIDNSGLSTPISDSSTHAVITDDNCWATKEPGGPYADYYDPAYSAPAPVLTFGFGGQQYALDGIVLWNYASSSHDTRKNGAKLVTVDFFQNDVDGWFGGVPLRVDEIGSGGWSHSQTLKFGGVFLAKAVRLTITDNYFDHPTSFGGGDRVGLSEVKFVAPEPSSLLLMGSGLLGLVCFVFLTRR